MGQLGIKPLEVDQKLSDYVVRRIVQVWQRHQVYQISVDPHMLAMHSAKASASPTSSSLHETEIAAMPSLVKHFCTIKTYYAISSSKMEIILNYTLKNQHGTQKLIKMDVWKMIFLLNWVLFRFHVHLSGCTHILCKKNNHQTRWNFCQIMRSQHGPWRLGDSIRLYKVGPYLGPQQPMKNESFTPQNMGEITPKNEGFGFPWY